MSQGVARRYVWLLAGVLAIAFAFTRLYQLMLLPVFIDEGLHIFWPTRLFEAGRFSRHLADGKSLQIWILSALQPFSPNPPLSARLCFVAMGGVGLAATYAIGRRLYGRAVAFTSAGLYIVCPFVLFHERMALADIYVSSFAALTLLASLRLVEQPGARAGLLLGLALSACVLAKMTGLVVAAIPLVAALILTPRRKGTLKSLGLAYAITALLCAYPTYYFLRHAKPWTHLLEMLRAPLRNAGVAAPAHTAAQGSGHANVILANLGTAFEWLSAYWTAPLFVLAVAAIGLAVLRCERPGLLLVICAVLPIASFAPVSRLWHPRYIVFSTIPLALLSARLLVDLGRLAATFVPDSGARRALLAPILTAGLAMLLSIPALRFDYALLTQPARAPLPAHDRVQYIESWFSGFGTVDVVHHLRERLGRGPGPLRVVTHRFANRAVFVVLRAYLMNEPRIELLDLDLDAEWDELAGAGERPTLIALGPADPPERGRPSALERPPGVVHVLNGAKPGGEIAVELYQIDGPGRLGAAR